MAEATIHHSVSTEKMGKWARIKEMFAEMDRVLAQAKQDQEETARLRAEIEANFAKLDLMRGQTATS